MSIEDYIAFHKTCVMCGKSSQFVVPADEYNRWHGGELIQNVWPAMSADGRELMMTGTHPECWDLLEDGDE